ncbi:hypothetical protein ALT721_2400024 [Alteromonas alvinellae]|jgi:2-keto-3-deoxy-L-rhamnonate aldolase RhmA
MLKQALKNKQSLMGMFIKAPHYNVIEVFVHASMDVPEFVAKSHNLIAIDVVYYAYLKQEKMNWFTKRDWLQVG